MCQDCPANTFAESAGIRLDGCAPCVTCSAGKFLGGCSATAGPGGCEACPRGRFLEGGKCSGCCPAGYPDPDVDCSSVSQLLASGIVASVEALWAGKWKKEGVKRWQFTTQGSVHSSPTLSPDGESVFVGSFDKRLYSINAGSGALRWSFSTSGVVYSKPAVSPDGATVFVGSGDYNLYALNAASGAKRWSFATRDFVYSSPVLSPDGAMVFVGSTDHNLYAINAVSGDKRWSFDTGGYVQSSPALSPDGSTVFVVSADFNMYAINAASGAKRWSFSVGALEGPWFYTRKIYQLPSPALSPDGATVFVGSQGSHDRGLHAINAVSGAKRWSFTTGSPHVTSTPAISPDGATVFFGTHSSKLYALDATSGANRWSFTTQGAVRSSPALSPDGETVFVGCDDTKLYAVDATSGVQRWSFTIGSAVGFCSSPTFSPDYSTIFVGSQGQEAVPPGKDGKLFAIVATSLSHFHVNATSKTEAFSCAPCTTCPAGQHTVQCEGQSGGTCKPCAPGTFASSKGVRIEGCAKCVVCADGKLAPNCTATSPGSCGTHWGAAKDTGYCVTLIVTMPYTKVREERNCNLAWILRTRR